MPIAERRHWIGAAEPLAITQQCALAGTNRSTVYAVHSLVKIDEQELVLLAAIDVEYTKHPFLVAAK